MQVYDAKNLKRYDKLAEKRRRVFILKTLFLSGLTIASAGLILYLLFFSGYLDIKDIAVNGLDKVSSDKFNDELNGRLNSKWLGLIGVQRNVVFFDSDDFKIKTLTVFPEIKDISVKKDLPNGLSIDVTERETAGIWCFTDGCRYFDKEGNTWGEAAKSSGFLILVVDDLRQGPPTQTMVQQGSPQVNRDLLSSMMFVLERLKEIGVLINKFTIPGEFIGDFSAFTSDGYELLFSLDSNIQGQLDVLEIFLAQKREESGFNPIYIDLRINGRIYYK